MQLMSSARPWILSISIVALASCEKKSSPAPHVGVGQGDPRLALAPLGQVPQWSQLEAYQETMTREEFQSLLSEVFALPGAWQSTISILPDRAVIRTAVQNEADPKFVLRFAATAQQKRPARYWRAVRELGMMTDESRPMAGLRIAIDPGHIGGEWAGMEERFFRVGAQQSIKEGDLTLKTGRILKTMLEALGAEVFMVRDAPAPITDKRPEDLREEARLEIARSGNAELGEQKCRERLFYRTAEIRARAEMVNKQVRPDMVICLHFNAENWGSAENPWLSSNNHFHLILSGALGADEIVNDDQRFEMLLKLLQRTHDEELSASIEVAAAMQQANGLPPFTYGSVAINISKNPYLWSRNLAANRLYSCPVIYAEPYIMNNAAVIARLQAGDYEGETMVGGKMQRSIFREYAAGVCEGLRSLCIKTRTPTADKR